MGIAHLLEAVELVLLANAVEDLEELGFHLGVVSGEAEIGDLVGCDGLLENLASERGKVLNVDTEDGDQ